MSILGTRVLRKEDPAFLTGGARYVADLDDPRLGGAVTVVFVRSQIAHGRIESIDKGDAETMPGVVAVLTAEDLGLGLLLTNPPAPDTMRQPALATDTVRFVGEPVVAVLAETEAQALDAAEQIWVDVEPLTPVVDVQDAATDEILLFPEAGTNTAVALPGEADDDLFDGCEVVVRQEMMNQRLAGCPLEGRAGAATWIDGRLVTFLSTQAAHAARDRLARWYQLDPGDVQVITPDVGGGFGPKIGMYAEYYVLGALARAAGRPVRWVERRTENMLAMGHGRAQHQQIKIGGTRDGRVLAYRLNGLQDAGAYPMVGAYLPFFTAMMAPGVYDIPRVVADMRSVVTNTAPTVAYRGAGRPEASEAIERAMDLFAAEIGMDPVEVRRRNLIPPFSEPYTTAVGAIYDVGDFAGALDRVLDAADYDQLRAEQAQRRAGGGVLQMGIGVSIYVEITAGPRSGQREFAEIVMDDDGEVTVFTGSSAHGQGHATSFSMLVSDATGVPMDRITVVHGDTDAVQSGVGTYASRSLQVGGTAVLRTADQVVERARELAADQLEADPSDVMLDPLEGAFHVAGAPAVTVTWTDVVAAAGGTLRESLTHKAVAPTFPFGAHVAVVDVDTETGKVELRRIITCDDAGRMLNPLLVEGQRHGGIAQGAAQVLCEEVIYDDDGNPQTTNFADYTVISAAELPPFELVTMETPTPVNPLGAKGVGESGTIGATPAIHSAVIDALAPFGVRHIEMPTTPQRVWNAIRAAADPEANEETS
ncbi:MAG: xanthine dehydrogenase family protein molybdopterin-binding subunit [Acidimicrobiales bacterium]